MARLILSVNSGEIPLVAATPKTVLQLKAPANQRLCVRHVKFFGKMPAGGTDTPVKVRMTRSTANFGTGSAATPGKVNPSDGETPQAVATVNLTGEPTSPADGGLWWEFSPQSGTMEPFSPGLEIEVPGGQAVNFEMTSAATPTVLAVVVYEE